MHNYGGWGVVPGSRRREAARRERVTGLGASDGLLSQVMRPLGATPRLETKQRAEAPAMWLARLDGWAGENKVRAADRVRTPAAGREGNTLRFHGGFSAPEVIGRAFFASGRRPREAPLTRRDTMKRKRSVLHTRRLAFAFAFAFAFR